MFDAETRGAVARIADARRIEPAALLAVVEVESAGKPFALVGGERVPLIRIEGHYFDRLVPADKRAEARAAGLASPKVGGVKNPSSQEKRYRMLERMMTIDTDAAIMSCSWGVGQVMGAHWEVLGYGSPVAFMRFVSQSLENQIEVMVRYVERFDLLDELQRLDWAGFARGYNGPAYAKHAYHTKMKRAYEKYSGAPARQSPAAGTLRMGSKGEQVRAVQVLLRRAGYPIHADGDFGPATKEAVKAFQDRAGLIVDGVVGPQTMAKLSTYQVTPEEAPGHVPATEIKEVRDGFAGGIGGAVTLETARRTIDEAIGRASDVPALEWLSTGLTAASVALVLAGLGWAAYGYFKSRRTVEQPA